MGAAPLLWLHRLNSTIALIVGIPLNALLIWLILKRTSKEKRMHSQILLQTCAMDMLVLVLAELVQPVFFVHDGIAYDIMVGQLSWLPNPLNHGMFLWWFTLFYLSLVGLGVQFVHRYLVLCKSVDINAAKYFAMLAAGFLSQVPTIGLLAVICYPSAAMETGEGVSADMINTPGVLQLLGNGPAQNGSWRLALRSDPTRPAVVGWCLLFTFCNSLLYAIIIWCAAKIRSSLARQMAQLQVSAWSAELNGQITRTLLVQAFLPALPLLFCCLGICSILFSSHSDGDSAILLGSQMLITVPFAWLPAANPLVSLWVVKQYRRWLLTSLGQLLLMGRKTAKVKSAIVVIVRRNIRHKDNGDNKEKVMAARTTWPNNS